MDRGCLLGAQGHMVYLVEKMLHYFCKVFSHPFYASIWYYRVRVSHKLHFSNMATLKHTFAKPSWNLWGHQWWKMKPLTPGMFNLHVFSYGWLSFRYLSWGRPRWRGHRLYKTLTRKFRCRGAGGLWYSCVWSHICMIQILNIVFYLVFGVQSQKINKSTGSDAFMFPGREWCTTVMLVIINLKVCNIQNTFFAE